MAEEGTSPEGRPTSSKQTGGGRRLVLGPRRPRVPALLLAALGHHNGDGGPLWRVDRVPFLDVLNFFVEFD